MLGFSLGANILVKYLGEEAEKTPFSAAISLSNPYDLVKADKRMNSPARDIVYSRHLVQGLLKYYIRFLESKN